MDISLFPSLIEQDLVRFQTHPTLPLRIFNYTSKCQWEKAWTPETLACRGLVLDDKDNIVARPFSKFFNWEEVPDQIPALPCDVYDKLDGSLLIVFNYDGQTIVATRGSFTSPQSEEGRKIIAEKYTDFKFFDGWTYLFEILYPENRIVVNYGDQRDIVLLSLIDTKMNFEIPSHLAGKYPFPLVKRHDFASTSLESLKATETKNQEGYVLRFSNGYRVKVKFDEYKRLHKIVTGLSTIGIWEALSAGQTVEGLCQDVPDEFYDWCLVEAAKIEHQYACIENRCKIKFRNIAIENGGRKGFAIEAMMFDYPAVLFHMLDGKDYAQVIWKLCRPERSTNPFRNRDEN